MLVTLSGITILVKPVQPENAELPMLVTPSPIVTLVKPVQPENALYPMLVTLSGIVTLVKPVQSSNAELPMLSPPFIITSCKLFCGISSMAIVGIVAFVMLQPENAELPMLVTPSPIVTLVKPVQPENALEDHTSALQSRD